MCICTLIFSSFPGKIIKARKQREKQIEGEKEFTTKQKNEEIFREKKIQNQLIKQTTNYKLMSAYGGRAV